MHTVIVVWLTGSLPRRERHPACTVNPVLLIFLTEALTSEPKSDDVIGRYSFLCPLLDLVKPISQVILESLTEGELVSFTSLLSEQYNLVRVPTFRLNTFISLVIDAPLPLVITLFDQS